MPAHGMRSTGSSAGKTPSDTEGLLVGSFGRTSTA